MSTDFTKQLNPEQLAVVRSGDGPCLVLAGAGSGKTRTVSYRVAYLLEQGVAPEEILLVTFTNKAAGAMQRRVQELTGAAHPLPWSGTFHHVGYRLLRRFAPLVGYKNNFTILDSDDAESLLKLTIKEVKPPEAGERKRFPSAAVVHAIISFSRNAQTPLSQVLAERFEAWQSWESEILHIARRYEERKQAAQGMDFDDLLTNTLHLIRQPPGPERYARQWRYILVDEYQDTNKIQAAIIRELGSVHRNVLVVGDDAQSIYSFRAADIANILEFERAYPGAKVFKLETNYRSSQAILEVANSVIAHNRTPYSKRLHTPRRGVRPVVQPQMDAAAEAVFIVNKIEALLASGVPGSEIAVLFRAAFHSQALEVELVSRGIAYDYRGGVRFFERAHVKDILAYLRILNNPADAAAWLRVLTHEAGIGPAAVERLIAAALAGADTPAGIAPLGQEIFRGRARAGWENFLRIWEPLTRVRTGAPSALVLALLKTPYREYLEAEYVDSRDRLQDLAQLAEFAGRFASLDEFLAAATLQESFRAVGDDSPAADSGSWSSEPGAQKTEDGSPKSKIALSTIHQAKGLEWTAVFVINLAAGAFPNERAVREPGGLDEERRLLYVAITRAKEQLYLTYPLASGPGGDWLAGPSVFLNEIKPGLVEDHSLLSGRPTVFGAADNEDVEYIPEDRPLKLRPGSFLQEIEDL